MDYNFTVYASGGEPLYTPFQSFQFHLEDIASSATLQERSDIIEVAMNALRAELVSRYPGATVNALRYYTKSDPGDTWPTP